MQATLLLPADKMTDRSETMCVYPRAVPPAIPHLSGGNRPRSAGSSGREGQPRLAGDGKATPGSNRGTVRTRVEDPGTCPSVEGGGKPLPGPVGNPNKMLNFLPAYRSGLSSNYSDLKEIM